MRRRVSFVAALVAAAPFLVGGVPAALGTDGRIELGDLESRHVEVGPPRFTTSEVLYDAGHGPPMRVRIHIALANRGKVAYWLVARLTPPEPHEERTGTVFLAPGEDTEFESSQDSLVADTDYFFDIFVIADSALTDTLEANLTRFRFDATTAASINGLVAFAGGVPEARSLPKTYEGLALTERFGLMGYLLPDPSRPGKLVVTPEGLEFTAKGKVVRCSASQLRDVSMTIDHDCVIVEYVEGGKMRRFGIQASSTTGNGLLVPVKTSIEALIEQQQGRKE